MRNIHIMKAKVYSADGAQVREIDLPEEVFERECSKELLSKVVLSYQANRRQGTAKTKTRAEVSGGTSKPWRQKGTGRARAGANTSPVWVRGGKAFGAKVRDYTTPIPRKMKLRALASSLTYRAREERVLVIDTLACEAPKTKPVEALLKALAIYGERTLLITDGDTNLYLSARNIRNARVKPVAEINAHDVIDATNIVFVKEELIDTMKEKVVRS
jgi:large subunit ribosomal protein L4